MGAKSRFRWKLYPSSQAWPLLSTSNHGETAIAKCGNCGLSTQHLVCHPYCTQKESWDRLMFWAWATKIAGSDIADLGRVTFWRMGCNCHTMRQDKSEGFDSCNRPGNLTQIGFTSLIFQPVLLWNLIAVCVTFTSIFVHHFKYSIWVKISYFFPLWPWNLMNDLAKSGAFTGNGLTKYIQINTNE